MSSFASTFLSFTLLSSQLFSRFVNVFVFFILMDSLFLLHYRSQALAHTFRSSGKTKGANRLVLECNSLALQWYRILSDQSRTHISSQTVIIHFENHFVCFSTVLFAKLFPKTFSNPKKWRKTFWSIRQTFIESHCSNRSVSSQCYLCRSVSLHLIRNTNIRRTEGSGDRF